MSKNVNNDVSKDPPVGKLLLCMISLCRRKFLRRLLKITEKGFCLFVFGKASLCFFLVAFNLVTWSRLPPALVS